MPKVTAREVGSLERGEGRKGYCQAGDTAQRPCHNKAMWKVTWTSETSEQRCTLHTNMVLSFYEHHAHTGLNVTVRRLKKGESIT